MNLIYGRSNKDSDGQVKQRTDVTKSKTTESSSKSKSPVVKTLPMEVQISLKKSPGITNDPQAHV